MSLVNISTKTHKVCDFTKIQRLGETLWVECADQEFEFGTSFLNSQHTDACIGILKTLLSGTSVSQLAKKEECTESSSDSEISSTKKKTSSDSILIVCMYKAQMEMIDLVLNQIVDRKRANLKTISVDNLTKQMQSSQTNKTYDHVILVTTRANKVGNVGTLRNMQLMNAVVSAPTKSLSIIGNTETLNLKYGRIWADVIAMFKSSVNFSESEKLQDILKTKNSFGKGKKVMLKEVTAEAFLKYFAGSGNSSATGTPAKATALAKKKQNANAEAAKSAAQTSAAHNWWAHESQNAEWKSWHSSNKSLAKNSSGNTKSSITSSSSASTSSWLRPTSSTASSNSMHYAAGWGTVSQRCEQSSYYMKNQMDALVHANNELMMKNEMMNAYFEMMNVNAASYGSNSDDEQIATQDKTLCLTPKKEKSSTKLAAHELTGTSAKLEAKQVPRSWEIMTKTCLTM